MNPPKDFRLQTGDDALVVAESLGKLAPLRMRAATTEEAQVASAPLAPGSAGQRRALLGGAPTRYGAVTCAMNAPTAT